MTVKQLKEELSKYPDNMDIYMADRKSDFKYGLLNGVYMQNISFAEDDDGYTKAHADVVILDEE